MMSLSHFSSRNEQLNDLNTILINLYSYLHFLYLIHGFEYITMIASEVETYWVSQSRDSYYQL